MEEGENVHNFPMFSKRGVGCCRPEKLSEKQTSRLDELLKFDLAAIKGYLLRARIFNDFGTISERTSRENFSTTNGSGADEEGGPGVAQTQTADSQLVQGQGAVIQWSGGGFKPQGKTHYEKSVSDSRP